MTQKIEQAVYTANQDGYGIKNYSGGLDSDTLECFRKWAENFDCNKEQPPSILWSKLSPNSDKYIFANILSISGKSEYDPQVRPKLFFHAYIIPSNIADSEMRNNAKSILRETSFKDGYKNFTDDTNSIDNLPKKTSVAILDLDDFDKDAFLTDLIDKIRDQKISEKRILICLPKQNYRCTANDFALETMIMLVDKIKEEGAARPMELSKLSFSTAEPKNLIEKDLTYIPNIIFVNNSRYSMFLKRTSDFLFLDADQYHKSKQALPTIEQKKPETSKQSNAQIIINCTRNENYQEIVDSLKNENYRFNFTKEDYFEAMEILYANGSLSNKQDVLYDYIWYFGVERKNETIKKEDYKDAFNYKFEQYIKYIKGFSHDQFLDYLKKEKAVFSQWLKSDYSDEINTSAQRFFPEKIIELINKIHATKKKKKNKEKENNLQILGSILTLIFKIGVDDFEDSSTKIYRAIKDFACSYNYEGHLDESARSILNGIKESQNKSNAISNQTTNEVVQNNFTKEEFDESSFESFNQNENIKLPPKVLTTIVVLVIMLCFISFVLGWIAHSKYENSRESVSTTSESDSLDNENDTDSTSYPFLQNGKLHVHYDTTTNGGLSQLIEDSFLYADELIPNSKVAKKQGWEFVGWNTEKDAENALTTLLQAEINTDDKITLFAIFKKHISVTLRDFDTEDKLLNEKTVYNNESDLLKTSPLPSSSCKRILDSGYVTYGWIPTDKESGNKLSNNKYYLNSGESIETSSSLILCRQYKKEVTVKFANPTIDSKTVVVYLRVDKPNPIGNVTLPPAPKGSGDNFYWIPNDNTSKKCLPGSVYQISGDITFTGVSQ